MPTLAPEVMMILPSGFYHKALVFLYLMPGGSCFTSQSHVLENLLDALALFFLRVTVDEVVAAVVTRHHNSEMVPGKNGI
jgi:hypothetical protein